MNSANFLRSARNENRIPTQIVELVKFCTDGAEWEKSSTIWCGHRGLLQLVKFELLGVAIQMGKEL